MATTTLQAMRATALTQIEGLTPVSGTDVSFVRSEGRGDFRAWAELNRQAAHRRFTINNNWDWEQPPVSNSDVEQMQGTVEVVVAYPEDGRYSGGVGDGAELDLQDIMDEDFESIDNVVGARATAYADGSWVFVSAGREDGEGISFLVLTYRYHYYRSV
jgi:hypothetical protein